MQAPLYSQIPIDLLKKVKSHSENKRKRSIDLYDEYEFSEPQNVCDEVTSSRPSNKPEEPEIFIEPCEPVDPIEPRTREVACQTEKEQEQEPPGSCTCTCSAKTETVLISQSSQTPEFSVTNSQHRNNLEAETLSVGYKPIYSIPGMRGLAPPLKIGLTLPKGKKRKVIYPGLEE